MDSPVLEALAFAAIFLMLPSIFLAQNSQDDYVQAHNGVRIPLGLQPMEWNTTLQEYAESYAKNRSNDCRLMLSDPPSYGENAFLGTPDNYTARDAVNAWAAEEQYYNYEDNTCMEGKVCGHYTQVVWNTSIELGCARARCLNGSVYITCNYYPAGNVVGQCPY